MLFNSPYCYKNYNTLLRPIKIYAILDVLLKERPENIKVPVINPAPVINSIPVIKSKPKTAPRRLEIYKVLL
jgi:hypothetical protein